MSVMHRLRRLTGEREESVRRNIAHGDREIKELRRRIEAIMARRSVLNSQHTPQRSKPLSLQDAIGGEEIHTPHGTFYLTGEVLDSSATHGDRCIGELTSIDMGAVALLANNPAIASWDITDGLFLDTETTGLSGGTGTVAFLIGVGWLEERSFITRQIFARDFSEERAGLVFLQEIAVKKRFLITYNGKAFDIGLLSTRQIMNRLQDGLSDLPHLDLLHLVRRLIGHRMINNRLATLEPTVLGFYREGDIPGSEIPQRYFDWLRRRDGRIISDIFRHNRFDVFSMAVLTAHLAELVSADPHEAHTHQRDFLAVARLYQERANFKRAEMILRCLIGMNHPDVSRDARQLLSLTLKRANRWEEAVCIWEEMVSENPEDIFAVEELAKWCEHRARDFKRGIDLVSQILIHGYQLSIAERDSLAHRLQRLQNRFKAFS